MYQRATSEADKKGPADNGEANPVGSLLACCWKARMI
jgi:hypothetical protein